MRLLIIGNLEGHMTTASKVAVERGVKVSNARTIEDGLKHLRQGKGADLVFIDIILEIGQFLHQCNKERISVPVIACGLEEVGAERAEQAILQGAREYLPLPPNPELIAQVLTAAGKKESNVIHKDVAVRHVLAIADQVAPTEATVLITGESGTGKEVFARYLHDHSNRSSGPFVALNCAAIPDNLLESELFGHERGAFTGAIAQRIGKFEEANDGTLLLDEISEMDVRLQAKLLRVIQEREITRIGGKAQIAVNARVLATSNRNLEQSVAEGSFRQDLFYRLNVINLQLPALRERQGDILVLAEHFRDKFTKTYHKPTYPFSEPAKHKLQAHDWPGNVRELENVIHGAVILCSQNEIPPECINIASSQSPKTSSESENNADAPLVGQRLDMVQRKVILDTYNHCLGNFSDTAAILGITVQFLRQRLTEYGELTDG